MINVLRQNANYAQAKFLIIVHVFDKIIKESCDVNLGQRSWWSNSCFLQLVELRASGL